MNYKFPAKRLRRSRMKAFSRELICENKISSEDLIYPIFIIEGHNKKEKIKSMPNIFRLTKDLMLKEAEKATKLGIPAIALFPMIDPEKKDKQGSYALDSKNLICSSVKLLKRELPNLGIICDVALDPYTSHGHDGLLINNEIKNDETIRVLCEQALIQADAGCDIIAPSDMMDGRVGEIRKALDKEGYINTLIMAYSAKYASSFYGPFREAVGSLNQLQFSKKSYQMDPANSNEAIHEVALDISEGSDMIIIKPGMPYLDILYQIKKKFRVPTFSYQVSGEYSMISLASEKGYINRENAIIESLIAFKRAGADGFFTYFALETAEYLRSNSKNI